MNKEDPVHKFFNSRKVFNNAIKNGVKKHGVKEDTVSDNVKSKFKTEKAYQKSFDAILEFEKKFTEKQKKQIDSVLYHTGNNDGISCAYIFWSFITKKGKTINKNILFKGIQPDHSSHKVVSKHLLAVKKHIDGRNVLLLDMEFNETSLEYIEKTAKSMIVIDNHSKTVTNVSKGIFSTTEHAACASSYLFFNPKNEVPLWVQYVDNDDTKLFLPFLEHTSYFSTFMQVRLTKCNMLTKRKAFDRIDGGGYEQMENILGEKDLSWLVYAGAYMNEIKENFNQILAMNAHVTKFYGYDVVIKNLEFQGLDKNVARQMITNRQNQIRQEIKKGGKGGNVDFAVLWSYHHQHGNFRIQLIDDHKQTKLSMVDIARQITQDSKFATGRGGGMKHVGNFFLKNIPGFLEESQHLNLKKHF
tara:strand:- start:878 stop:2122 length:1245 start_codon:yes stop_codon:yes gene_type:complete